VEHPTGVRRRVWPGTFTAVASWLVVSWGFGLYAVSMSSYALYYGSLAAVAVMMVWLYLTSLSLVVGAEVNAHLERRAGGG
jgi:membrane protein